MTHKGPTDPHLAALFAEQIRIHSRLFLKLAYGVLRNGGDAEDICQQSFLRAWERLDQCRTPDEMKAWISSVIYTESLKLLRRRKIELRARQSHAELQATGQNDLIAIERHESVFMALQALPDRQREIVMLKFMQGVSGNDAAELLGCSPGEVSKQFYRALEKLRLSLANWAQDSEVS